MTAIAVKVTRWQQYGPRGWLWDLEYPKEDFRGVEFEVSYRTDGNGEGLYERPDDASAFNQRRGAGQWALSTDEETAKRQVSQDWEKMGYRLVFPD